VARPRAELDRSQPHRRDILAGGRCGAIEPSELRAEIERQTHLWQETVQVVFQQVVNQASLRIITSLFAMMMHRNNIVAVAGTEVSAFSQLVANAC
jgi:hypothetical protein